MKLLYDVEVAPNRAMVGFMDAETGEVWQYQHNGSKAIKKLINNCELISFNGRSYDDAILTDMLNGATAKQIYQHSKFIIEGKFGDKFSRYDEKLITSIDLMQIAPGTGSLKMYGARLGAKKIQDLPYDYDSKHTKKMWKEVMEYNINDLELTKIMYDELIGQIDVRREIGKKYKVNVLNRSDAQIAEVVFQSELLKFGIDAKRERRKWHSPTRVTYNATPRIKFKSKVLKQLLKKLDGEKFQLASNGKIIMPKWLNETVIPIGGNNFNLGLGGLHSQEKSLSVEGDLGNIDVTSMYPYLIITLGLFPPHLGKHFLNIYENIVNKRVAAKRSGDTKTNKVLKIVLNGTFGKLGSVYSLLYAPELLLTITITGQLYLLMLIEALHTAGVKVISSNTDGIEYVNGGRKTEKKVKKIVEKWEKQTKLNMEYGYYKALHARDVNNYVAVYEDEIKTKGIFSLPDIEKNPEFEVVVRMVQEYFFKGTPLIQTMFKYTDSPLMFTKTTKVTGGAVWSGTKYPNTDEYESYIKKMPFKRNKALEKRNEEYQKQFVLAEGEKAYIGKTVRFYYSKNGYPIYSAKRGSKVPVSDGCVPMMEVTKSMPKDIDYQRYLDLAVKMIRSTGYEF